MIKTILSEAKWARLVETIDQHPLVGQVYYQGECEVLAAREHLELDEPVIGSKVYFNGSLVGYALAFPDPEHVQVRLLSVVRIPVSLPVLSEKEKELFALAEEFKRIRLSDDQQETS